MQSTEIDQRGHRLPILRSSIQCFAIVFGITLIGIEIGNSLLVLNRNTEQAPVFSVFRMDASNYKHIVERGYEYSMYQRSRVAFFPGYPSICSLLCYVFGCRPELSLIFTSCAFCFLTMVFSNVLISRNDPTTSQWTLGAMFLYPPCFFFLMPYAESMLCCLVVLALLGMKNRWPLWVLATIAGTSTLTRPVGIALSLSVWWYAITICLYSSSHPMHERGVDWRFLFTKFIHLFWLIPLSCWGLLAYMAYLWWAFDAPFAFAQTQEHWSFLAPQNYTLSDKFWSLLTLEPIWNVYNPTSQRFWMRGDTQSNPLFSCLFWNPIFYLLAWLLIGLGWWKKWLKDYEIVLSIGLLLIPYMTRAYEMSMASHARFSAVVIPQYFVLGRLFAKMPSTVAGCLCGLMGLMMGLWTALFVAGYRFF